MKFCFECGAGMEQRVPAGDDRERWACTTCEYIHYENPRTVAGCVVEEAGKVLLCRRAIEPARGLWTIPAGFLELGESTREGALRETLEEAEAEVSIGSPHAYLDIPAHRPGVRGVSGLDGESSPRAGSGESRDEVFRVG